MAHPHAWRRSDAGRRGWGEQYGRPGAAARTGPGTPRATGAALPGAGPPHPDAARGPGRGGPGLERLPAPCACVPGAADNAGHGGGAHGPWLDEARPAVVAGAAISLGTTEAAWASFTGAAASDCTVVRTVTTVHCGA